MKYIRLFRIKHYIKNILIFLPLLFSGQLFNLPLSKICCLGFVGFSIMCSGIYIINDVKDIDKDRQHPTKKERPLASGEISVNEAIFIAIGCILISFLISIFSFGFLGCACLLIYLFINMLYSISLKNYPIIDVTILVFGFFLRVLFGSIITNIEISTWLFLTIIAISFYLALGKRRNELRVSDENGGVTREVLSHYNYAFLDKNMYMCMALANVFYSLWAANHNNEKMIWTVPMVIIISMKYSLIVEGESEGDPVEVILNDKFLILFLIIYITIDFVLLYIVN